ncbi:MAG: hypothetical protein UY42_C0026G0004 [Parcubacteria group bacterium GW2011_GWA2_49_16]|nr:MAG: hypothetical protein UY42_C0026G0004 [Parcubacteria group bacterium GW2011_GWA2_49_16]
MLGLAELALNSPGPPVVFFIGHMLRLSYLLKEWLHRIKLFIFENTSGPQRRAVGIIILILFLSTLTTVGLYGSPVEKLNLNFYENGKHLYEPLATKTLIAEILGVPTRIPTYTLHFAYEQQNGCLQLEGYKAYVRLDVKEDQPFARYASKVFDEKSCYSDFGYMPQHYEGQYYFCLNAPSSIEFAYPADQQISFSSILFSDGNCLLDLGEFKVDERLRYEDLSFYATPSRKEWAIGWIGVSLVWVLIVGGILTVREYVWKG